MGKIYVKAEVEYRFDVPDDTNVNDWFAKLEQVAAAGFKPRAEYEDIVEFWLGDNACQRCGTPTAHVEGFCSACRANYFTRVPIVEVQHAD